MRGENFRVKLGASCTIIHFVSSFVVNSYPKATRTELAAQSYFSCSKCQFVHALCTRCRLWTTVFWTSGGSWQSNFNHFSWTDCHPCSRTSISFHGRHFEPS